MDLKACAMGAFGGLAMMALIGAGGSGESKNGGVPDALARATQALETMVEIDSGANENLSVIAQATEGLFSAALDPSAGNAPDWGSGRLEIGLLDGDRSRSVAIWEGEGLLFASVTFAWRLRVSGSGAQTSFGTGGFPLFDDEQLSRGASGPGEWSGTWTLNALGRLTLGMTTDKAATLEYRIVDVTRIQ